MTDIAATKALFHLPDGKIYLDSSSLGLLPRAAPARMAAVLADEWGQMLIGDFRAPDIIRCGFTPLFIDPGDVAAAVGIIADVMTNRLWNHPEYHARTRVS